MFHDLTGSYGVNIFGNDFYKECIAEGEKRAHALGPVLGSYHPVVTDNVRRLCEISGLDEVSFHMSGTEAVMQAVRLARYHTRRTHLVRFAGAYHGWWGDVQPGVDWIGLNETLRDDGLVLGLVVSRRTFIYVCKRAFAVAFRLFYIAFSARLNALLGLRFSS